MQHSVGTIPGKANESNCVAAASSHLEVLPTSEHLVGAVVLPLSLLQLPKQSVTPNVSGVPTTSQSIVSWIQTVKDVKDCKRHRLLSTLRVVSL